MQRQSGTLLVKIHASSFGLERTETGRLRKRMNSRLCQSTTIQANFTLSVTETTLSTKAPRNIVEDWVIAVWPHSMGREDGRMFGHCGFHEVVDVTNGIPPCHRCSGSSQVGMMRCATADSTFDSFDSFVCILMMRWKDGRSTSMTLTSTTSTRCSTTTSEEEAQNLAQ